MKSKVLVLIVGAILGMAAQTATKKAFQGATKPIGPYTPGIATGDLVFLSGQLGLNPATGNLAEGGVKAEARQAMENLGKVLAEAGLGFENVVKTTIYLADINDFAAVNEIYGSFFPQGSVYPVRSTVGVAALPRGARVEIDFIAAR
jgi:2-iminobutanoate/2-iminopropanoate deaminase